LTGFSGAWYEAAGSPSRHSKVAVGAAAPGVLDDARVDEGGPLSAADSKPRVPPAKKAYDALSVGSLGLEMGLAVFVGWWVGQWLDARAGTRPYLMLLFLGCGIAAAFKALFRAAKQTKRAAAESQGAGEGEEGPAAGPGGDSAAHTEQARSRQREERS
jgi:F0F1-type ATP synthase assembly protein I